VRLQQDRTDTMTARQVHTHGHGGAVAAALLLGLLAGCASKSQEVYDPLEPMNRAIFRFNDTVDRAVLEPVARGYRYVTPEPVRGSVRNFLGNLRSPVIFANDLLQGEGERAGVTLSRFMINTSLGLAGLFDVAGPLGYQQHEEDFGQTLGSYGLKPGAYLMLPFLGPSNVRDAGGRVGDYFIDPFNSCCIGTTERYARFGTGTVSDREQAIEVVDDLRRNTLDMYSTVRSAYSQRRAAQIRNGAAPVDDQSYDDIFKDPEGGGDDAQ
jgi:phospholipid-binding lipoprotein MlaA